VFSIVRTSSTIAAKAKIRLRLVGIQNKGSDTELLEEDQLWWKPWIKKLDRLNGMKIPRYVTPRENMKEF